MDKEARRLRSQEAEALAGGFLAEFTDESADELLLASPFKDHSRNFRSAEPAMLLAFNLEVTRHLVAQLVQDEQNPSVLAFVSARIAELGTYQLHDPRHPQAKPQIYLGASKQAGYFFTPPEIAFLMAEKLLTSSDGVSRVLDPCAGSGSLLAATMILAANRGTGLQTLCGIEVDPFTIGLARQVLERVRDLLGSPWILELQEADAIELLHSDVVDAPGRYDGIIMNPPYGRVKFLKSALTNRETQVGTNVTSLGDQHSHWNGRTKAQADRFRAISRDLGLGEGAQDYQRLFIGLSMAALGDSGRLVFIAPSSWLGDLDSQTLRTRILESKRLEEVILFPETAGLFATVNQPTAVTVLSSPSLRATFSVSPVRRRTPSGHDVYNVSFDRAKTLDSRRRRIPRLARDQYELYEALSGFSRVREYPTLKNARGELDLTLSKKYITTTPSDLRLIRGDHIERYVLRDPEASKRQGFIDETAFRGDFATSPKYLDTQVARIAGRQVSYLNKGRRLSFTLVPHDVVLANSCNYLLFGESDDNFRALDKLKALVVVLNSLVLEWYFRVFNSNNHVANYEIDDFPICLGDPVVTAQLAQLCDYLHATYGTVDVGGKVPTAIEDVVDGFVARAFGLSADQTHSLATSIDPARANRIANIVRRFDEKGFAASLLDGEGWFQHVRPGLSALDIEMIGHVPQGGNWENIPASVPSTRIGQIRQMTAERGKVRTTYYGRLRPDQPAYTIATYYNRPGNGTNIHPWEDRTLTSREAARLQSFPDWYVFVGPETAVRKQIGNAVPPLLALALGNQLASVLDVTNPTCVDLFAGAGGLSLGLEMAGWSVRAAADNAAWASKTYRLNRPCDDEMRPDSAATYFLDSDLLVADQRDSVWAQAEQKLTRPLDLLIGGPPCQGFSHAGWRTAGDQRNDLASVFMEAVERLDPTLVVLENVEGLLSYNKGQVVSDLLATLKDLGYDIGDSPWILKSECFGVPQMRRRVFLVGSKGVPAPEQPRPRFQQCLGRRESSTAMSMFPDSAYPITVAEAIGDLRPLGPRTHEEVGRRPVRTEFAKWAKGLLTAQELLENLSPSGALAPRW